MLHKGGVAEVAATAEELTQEFAVRILRGDFKRFDPERGRFRDFVKLALRRLVMDYWRQQKQQKEKKPCSLQPGRAKLVSSPDIDFDQAFIEKWREELLGRA